MYSAALSLAAMQPRRLITAVVLCLATAAAVVFGTALWLVVAADVDADRRLLWIGGLGVLAYGTALAGAWYVLIRHFAEPVAALERDVETFLHSSAGGVFTPPTVHALGGLPEALVALSGEVTRARQQMLRAMQAAAARADEQVGRLEAVLRDLSEGVIVCTLEHDILLYNPAAVWFVDRPERLGLGRPIFDLIDRDSVDEALHMLTDRERDASATHTAEVVLRTHEQDVKLRGRIALMRGRANQTNGYVIAINAREDETAPGGKPRPRVSLPPRPEFYDFDLIRRGRLSTQMKQRPLADISFVVFDTETTGLKPSEGDDMVQIGGVRVVNRRILTGEVFDRLINPKRPIPRASTRFHGITDETVRNEASVEEVLPAFHAFVGSDVLVAHNAAFDMKFLSLKETACGVRFNNPVLDTLLLSAYLHDHEGDHRLDVIAGRFGVEVDAALRHTALGDSMVTASIFLHLLELLEGRGITTLGAALEASESMFTLRKMQQWF